MIQSSDSSDAFAILISLSKVKVILLFKSTDCAPSPGMFTRTGTSSVVKVSV